MGIPDHLFCLLRNLYAGQEATVSSMGTKAVVLTYVVPFFVLVAGLVGALAAGAGEGVAVLVTLCGVAAYYLVLYALRHRIKNTIKFIIIKQTK